MAIEIGQSLPSMNFSRIGENGPEWVPIDELTKGRRVILFGLPGAFTSTCSALHLPSFMRTRPDFAAKGIDEIVCVSVNDPFVMKAWGETSGATEAGITLLADSAAEFTKAIGMAFTVEISGFYDRSGRYAMVVDDGVVTHLQIDPAGQCSLTTGETFLATL